MPDGMIKALELAKAAKRHGWHGQFDSEIVDGVRITVLKAARNGESLRATYQGDSYSSGEYQIYTRKWNLHCASVALEKLEGWPDLIKMFKWFPMLNRPLLVDMYRKLPFSLTDPNEEIIPKLLGQKIFWYNSQGATIETDIVLHPRSSDGKNFRIADVGHRKLFHFIGAAIGFRSAFLDMLIKVG